MAHTIAHTTLGLTQISPVFEAPKLTFATKEIDVTEWKGAGVGVTQKDLAKDQNSKFENLILKKLDSCLGAVLGIYEDNRYKSESKKPALKSVDSLGLGIGPELEKKLKNAQDVASVIILGKELTNSPANVLTPRKLAEEATNIASLYSDVLQVELLPKGLEIRFQLLAIGLEIWFLSQKQCKDLKMGSYLAMAAASANPPHFIHLTYKPPGEPAKLKLAWVGKGLTFDR
ncbi:putative aminopeptidase [Rosa chinensis]|uniref:Putative aminopeptidase n=1 Tax=Rosa chinensis TaxID=74649 RepID=A0A2P6PBX3_ROSCH|nr:putative aminopeptidase [Rosa chinensis]